MIVKSKSLGTRTKSKKTAASRHHFQEQVIDLVLLSSLPLVDRLFSPAFILPASLLPALPQMVIVPELLAHHDEGFVQDVEDENESLSAKNVCQFSLDHSKCSLSFIVSFALTFWDVWENSFFRVHGLCCGRSLISPGRPLTGAACQLEPLQSMIQQFWLNNRDISQTQSSIRAVVFIFMPSVEDGPMFILLLPVLLGNFARLLLYNACVAREVTKFQAS